MQKLNLENKKTLLTKNYCLFFSLARKIFLSQFCFSEILVWGNISSFLVTIFSILVSITVSQFIFYTVHFYIYIAKALWMDANCIVSLGTCDMSNDNKV